MINRIDKLETECQSVDRAINDLVALARRVGTFIELREAFCTHVSDPPHSSTHSFEERADWERKLGELRSLVGVGEQNMRWHYRALLVDV